MFYLNHLSSRKKKPNKPNQTKNPKTKQKLNKQKNSQYFSQVCFLIHLGASENNKGRGDVAQMSASNNISKDPLILVQLYPLLYYSLATLATATQGQTQLQHKRSTPGCLMLTGQLSLLNSSLPHKSMPFSMEKPTLPAALMKTAQQSSQK